MSTFQKHWHVFGGKSCHFCRKYYQFCDTVTATPRTQTDPPLSAGNMAACNGKVVPDRVIMNEQRYRAVKFTLRQVFFDL
jgi:hypothetical protein